MRKITAALDSLANYLEITYGNEGLILAREVDELSDALEYADRNDFKLARDLKAYIPPRLEGAEWVHGYSAREPISAVISDLWNFFEFGEGRAEELQKRLWNMMLSLAKNGMKFKIRSKAVEGIFETPLELRAKLSELSEPREEEVSPEARQYWGQKTPEEIKQEEAEAEAARIESQEREKRIKQERIKRRIPRYPS